MGLTYGHPGGGMYIYANVSSTGVDAENFCYELLKQEHVLVFPGTLFADTNNQHIRLTLLSPENMISEALVRLARFTKKLRDNKIP
jgi:aminotransferase